MTIASPLKSVREDALDDAVLKACAWRGRCINLFARAEAAVTEGMRQVGLEVRPAMGLRQRIRTFSDSAPDKLRERLAALDDLLATRNALTHGCQEVGIQRDGWLLVLVHDNGAGRVQLAFTEAEAEQFRHDLHRAVQRLEQAPRSKPQTPGPAAGPSA